MNAAIKNVALAAILAGAVTLSGCAIVEPASTADPKPAATETAKAEAPAVEAKRIVESVIALEVGTRLTDEQAEVIARDFKNGVKAYTLPNGDKVLLKKAEELPKEVVKAEQDKLAVIDMPTTSGEQGATIEKLSNAASSASFSTGKIRVQGRWEDEQMMRRETENVPLWFEIRTDSTDSSKFTIDAFGGFDDAPDRDVPFMKVKGEGYEGHPLDVLLHSTDKRGIDALDPELREMLRDMTSRIADVIDELL